MHLTIRRVTKNRQYNIMPHILTWSDDAHPDIVHVHSDKINVTHRQLIAKQRSFVVILLTVMLCPFFMTSIRTDRNYVLLMYSMVLFCFS